VEAVCNDHCRQHQPASATVVLSDTTNNAADESDSQAKEVQNFFGWAIKEVIDNWYDKVREKVTVVTDEEDVNGSDEYKCLVTI